MSRSPSSTTISKAKRWCSRLTPFDVLVITRERTPFPRALVERLPNLKLLVTTGMRNLGHRFRRVPRARRACLRHRSRKHADGGACLGSHSRAGAAHSGGRPRAPGGQVADAEIGFGLKDKVLGILGLGRLGRAGGAGRPRFRHEDHRLEPESDSRRAPPKRACTRVEKDELFRPGRRADHSSSSQRAHAWTCRTPRDRADEAERRSHQHRARRDCGREGAHRRAHAGKIAGAGLDVYSREPLPPDAPILHAPNTVLTPHLGYVTRETYEIYYPQALEDIEAWLEGAPIRVIAGLAHGMNGVRAHPTSLRSRAWAKPFAAEERAKSWRPATSACAFTKARSSPSSARRAAARRRCSISLPDC